jgi:putative membrane protein
LLKIGVQVTEGRVMKRRSAKRLVRAAGVGAVAGLAGAWAMSEFSRAWGKLVLKQDPHPVLVNPGKLAMHASPQEWDSTVAAADMIGEHLRPHGWTREQRAMAATVVHYAMGATMGAAYGVATELMPMVRTGSGVAFGAVLWAVGVETALPALGITRKLKDYPASMQAHCAGEHIVYGLTTELVRSAMKKAI